MASKPDGSIFKHAESLRSSLTKEQQKRIKKLYEDWAKDIEERAAKLAKKTNPSATLSNAQANILKKQIEATGKQVANGVYTEVKNGMLEVSEAVLGDAGKFMKGLGFPEDGISAAFSNVSASVVNSLVTGSVYGKPGSWSLSKSIWSDNEGTMQKAYEIVAKGIAENLPVQDIAELLHDFVSPDRRVPWVGPKGSRIYTKKIDYNAQRLARTLSQHTYQQSMVAAVEDNPFIDSFRWVSNGSRACDLCKQRDGKIFKKDEVPLDHPNGMCVMEPVADVDEMTTRLADWVKGKDDPDVDKFAKHFGYEKPKSMSLDDIKKKYTQGIDSKIPSKWYKGLPKDVQEEVTKIHQASGMKWKDWYQKHIMKGGAGSIDDVAKSTTQKAVAAAKPKPAKHVDDSMFPDDIDPLYALKVKYGSVYGKTLKKLESAKESKYGTVGKAAEAFTKQFEDEWDELREKLKALKVKGKVYDYESSSAKYSLTFVEEIREELISNPDFAQDVLDYYKGKKKMPDGVLELTSDSAKKHIADIEQKLAAKEAAEAARKKAEAEASEKKRKEALDKLNGSLTHLSFKDVKAAMKKQTVSVMNKIGENDLKQLSQDALRQLKRYTGHSYEDFNKYLRLKAAGADLSEFDDVSVKEACELLVSEFKKIKTDREYVLRRGTDSDDLVYSFLGGSSEDIDRLRDLMSSLRDDVSRGNNDKIDEALEQLKKEFVGQVGEFSSFTSCSSGYDKGFGGKVEYILEVPKGANGCSVMTESRFGETEGEFLLGPGCNVVCTGVEILSGDTAHMDCLIRVHVKVLPAFD